MNSMICLAAMSRQLRCSARFWPASQRRYSWRLARTSAARTDRAHSTSGALRSKGARSRLLGDARGFGLPSPPIPRLGPFQLAAIMIPVALRQAPGERPHARPRRPHPHRAARCGLGGLCLDPLAVLRRDPVGNRAGHRVCAALSPAIQRHGAAPQPCRASRAC